MCFCFEAGPAFAAAAASRRAFSLISDIANSAPPKPTKRYVALALVAAMVAAQVATAAIGGAVEARADLFLLASLTAGAMLATRCMSCDAARAAIKWDVYVTVAFAFALATAMDRSAIGAAVSAGLEAMLNHGGGRVSHTAALTVVYIATCWLSELVSNDAAAALMFPVALSLADAFAIPRKLAAVSLALGGSADWILPFLYQCNLMVRRGWMGGKRKQWFFKLVRPPTPSPFPPLWVRRARSCPARRAACAAP